MKTIAITAVIIFGTFQMYASELIINGNTPKPFSIAINGRTYDSHGGQIIVNNLSAGNYKVLIFSRNNGKSHHQNQKTNYEFIKIPANAVVNATAFANNSLTITNISIRRPQNSHVKTHPTPHCEKVYYERAMSQSQFNDLYNYLSHIQFDSERIFAVKNALYDENFNSNQAYDLVNLFNFEDYRLEIAKLAYDKTIDKNNYYKVFELLSFESSKRELDRYMDSPQYYKEPMYSYHAR